MENICFNTTQITVSLTQRHDPYGRIFWRQKPEEGHRKLCCFAFFFPPFSFFLSFPLTIGSTSQRSWEMLQDSSKNGQNVRNCSWPCHAHIPKGSVEPRAGTQDARTPGHAPGHPHGGCPSLESSWLPFSTGCYFLQNPCVFLGIQEFPFAPH